MFEEGLVSLLQADPAVGAMAPYGGFMSILPKGIALPAWCYTVVTEKPEYTLRGKAGLIKTAIQIDCFGDSGADALALAYAIDNVLSGYRGTLPDPDATGIDSCFETNRITEPLDPASRTFRVILEYEIWVYEGSSPR
jgi:hypothetical protein